VNILVFDFLSHATMHHPFNEGYLRLLRAGFPGDEIVFHAAPGHVNQMAPRLTPEDRITLRACAPFEPPYGLSRHHPLAGRIAARRCLAQMRAAMRGQQVRLAAVLGVDANLHAVLAQAWREGAWRGGKITPLHCILHNHIGAALRWRTRNPLFRPFDLIAAMRKPLPPPMRLVALELGIADAVAERFPAAAPALMTLEHPILVSEWAEETRAAASGPLRIAHLGNASVSKGFDLFVGMAGEAPAGLEFHSIGTSTPEAEALDLSCLRRRPSARSVPRADYVAALAEMDLVCLPLSAGYDFVASGSVIDAVAALKPLLCVRNRSLDEIVRRYGAIGYMADSSEDLRRFVRTLDRASFETMREEWVGNLARMRAARTPSAQAGAYGELCRPHG